MALGVEVHQLCHKVGCSSDDQIYLHCRSNSWKQLLWDAAHQVEMKRHLRSLVHFLNRLMIWELLFVSCFFRTALNLLHFGCVLLWWLNSHPISFQFLKAAPVGMLQILWRWRDIWGAQFLLLYLLIFGNFFISFLWFCFQFSNYFMLLKFGLIWWYKQVWSIRACLHWRNFT